MPHSLCSGIGIKFGYKPIAANVGAAIGWLVTEVLEDPGQPDLRDRGHSYEKQKTAWRFVSITVP